MIDVKIKIHTELETTKGYGILLWISGSFTVSDERG